MDADEKAICNYLKSFPGQFVALKEVCRRAGGKWRFQDNENWATPILLRLVNKGLVEDDTDGHFRLVPVEPTTTGKKAKWMSPHIRKILEQSGKSFGIETDQD